MILVRNFLNIFLISLLVLGLIINPSLFQNPVDSSNYFVSHYEFTPTDLMKFAFAQSDENVMNQTESENTVELDETISIIEEEVGVVNATKLENITVVLDETITITEEGAEVVNATKMGNVTVVLDETITITGEVAEAEAEEAEEEQNWILILIGIVIAAVVAGIAIALSKRKKATSKKGSTIKKFCGKCGSAVDRKTKFCGKCGASLYQKK